MVSTPPVPPGRPDPDDLEPDPTGIRALLGGLPDPGPMPADLIGRINASIAAEQTAREGHLVVPLRPRPAPRWRQAFAVAAAVAAVGVAVPTLMGSWGGSGADTASSFSTYESAQDSGAGAPTGGSPGPAAADGGRARSSTTLLTIHASNTAYTTARWRTQVQAFIDHPPDQVMPLATESPALGPVATPLGLQPCLDGLAIPSSDAVAADLGTFDGQPAVLLVVTSDTGVQAYAVPRTCAAGPFQPLAGPVAVN